MIYGRKTIKEKDYYIQTNNPTENILLRGFGKRLKPGEYLQSCGPSAAINCMSPLITYMDLYKKLFKIRTYGGYLLQPEEILMDYFNSHFSEQKNMPNRIPWLYPTAVKAVFDFEAEYHEGDLDFLIEQLKMEKTVQVLLRKPSHFIAVTKYDTEKKVFIYTDSWPRKANNYDGFDNVISRAEAEKNFMSNLVVYKGVIL